MKFTSAKNTLVLLLCLSHNLHCSESVTTQKKTTKKNSYLTTRDYATGAYVATGTLLTLYGMYNVYFRPQHGDGTDQEDTPSRAPVFQIVGGIWMLLSALPFINDILETPDKSATSFGPAAAEKNSEEPKDDTFFSETDTASSDSETDVVDSLRKAYRCKACGSACTTEKINFPVGTSIVTHV